MSNIPNKKTYKKLLTFILNHIVLALVSICLPIFISWLYTKFEPSPHEDHFKLELLVFIIWFVTATIIDYFLISKIAKKSILTKKGADIYKFCVSILYFFALTLMSFLTIDKLIGNQNASILAFLITISFGSLSPIATYQFRNHKGDE
ncbi:hypothetical protein M3D73_02570 [Staphylococcus epidermidis]|uniref:hypothetical protein n=1 Tax=Staphylococcus epidermidis TaxID=1282 RepID=UPI0021A3802E|nr:hypothetical protein [Staphylococcus epidermidis]MCT2095568.1 hypothetical protein [Staphylococcus epidermidis]MCT2125762.1 hypothetical protein [Staphylococcus epidermidis]MCT2210422.1 hypothetical protein [Staphylococcus epidermidis]